MGDVFTNRSTLPTPSGGTIFLCLKKDSGERQTKGLRPPLDPRGNVLEEAGRTVCLPPRNGACDAIKSAAALSLIPLPLRAAPRRRGSSIAVGSALGVRCG